LTASRQTQKATTGNPKLETGNEPIEPEA